MTNEELLEACKPWASAWEAQMHDFGFPDAHLDLFIDPGGPHPVRPFHEHVTMSWDIVSIEAFEPPPYDEDEDKRAWFASMKAFVMVNHLRPRQLELPPMIQAVLTRQSLNDVLNSRN